MAGKDRGRLYHGLALGAVTLLGSLAFYFREVIQNGFAGMGWHSFGEAIAAPGGAVLGALLGAAVMTVLWVVGRRK